MERKGLGRVNKISCPDCRTEVPEGTKYCPKCGKLLPKVEVFIEPEEITVCPKCQTKLSPGTVYCTECGKLVNDDKNINKETVCPVCGVILPPNTRFCTACGANILDVTKNKIECPQCNVLIDKGLKFCTQCGAKVAEDEPPKRRISVPGNNEWLNKSADSLSKSGQGLLKEVDTLLNSAAKSLESSNTNKKEDGPKLIKPLRIKGVEYPEPGYLICNECGGYYPLKACEGPDDFSAECECGGRLQHLKKLPQSFSYKKR